MYALKKYPPYTKNQQMILVVMYLNGKRLYDFNEQKIYSNRELFKRELRTLQKRNLVNIEQKKHRPFTNIYRLKVNGIIFVEDFLRV